MVIAIIAILAAILFPVFARARENARRASCSSNLKQIGLGILQYYQDYDESFPTDFDGTISYRGHIQPYLKSRQIWRCPSNPDNTAFGGSFGTLNGEQRWLDISYATNPRLICPDWASVPPKLAFIQSPSQKILLAETNRYGNWGYMYPDFEIGGSQDQVEGVGFAGHLGTANYLFIDGHVKALRPTATGSPINMWGTMLDNANTSGQCAHANNQQSYGQGINCDEVSPAQMDGLAKLTAKYK